MDEDFSIAVSPRHRVRLAREYESVMRKAPRRDFVVRTLVRREANGMPLMSAEIVIAGAETRAEYPLADAYPLHFRKTYFPGRLHGDPKQEFDCQGAASRLIDVPPPIGYAAQEFRTCLIPGMPYGAICVFDAEPEDRNFPRARELPVMAAAGHWKLVEEAYVKIRALHAGGLAHGDAVLRNFIVCPSPLEIVPVDFEVAAPRDTFTGEDWARRCELDLEFLLRQAAFLQCSLGPQPGALAEHARDMLDHLFKDPDRVRREIDSSSDLGG